jgi:hypothetical protein
MQAIQQRVHLVNISSGQFSPSGAAYPLLASAVSECARQGILILAAAGNEGCACLHVPAALDTVLAVGAMDAHGEPLAFSNWGEPYRRQGLLAPGQDLPGAQPGGGVVQHSGTSYATALVTGVAALLLSLQRKRGERPNPRAVREILLRSAIGCRSQPAADCRRLLAGRLNVSGAVSILTRSMPTMSEPTSLPSDSKEPNLQPPGAVGTTSMPVPTSPPAAPSIQPSAAAGCTCPGAAQPQRVFALGQIGYEFSSEARLDSLVHGIANFANISPPHRSLAFDVENLLAYLKEHPHDAAFLEWTLSLDGHPIYAVRPQGAFDVEVYRELRRFLKQRFKKGVERVSVPGVLAGTSRLLTGQVLPVIVPEMRGMYSWKPNKLVKAVVGDEPQGDAENAEYKKRKAAILNFLERVYHELRNLGQLPQDRALNYAATNLFAINEVYKDAIEEEMELESVRVEPSPICRPTSECWEVLVYFFFPRRETNSVRKVYRFTVDVSEPVPVTVGGLRSWFTR